MKTFISLIQFSLILAFILISSVSFSSDEKRDLIKDIQTYFLNLKTLEADFIQIGPRGNISKGKLYLDLPGKIRIDYKQPNNLLITSQGFWLYIQDRKLKQTNNVPIKQTPLNYLLKKNIDFNNKSLDLKIKKEAGLIILSIKELNKLDESKLILQFSEKPLNLKKWVIEDEFNNQTNVLLQNLHLGIKRSHLLFFHDEFELEEK